MNFWKDSQDLVLIYHLSGITKNVSLFYLKLTKRVATVSSVVAEDTDSNSGRKQSRDKVQFILIAVAVARVSAFISASVLSLSSQEH